MRVYVRDAKRLSIVYYVMYGGEERKREREETIEPARSSSKQRPDRYRGAYAVFSIGGAPKTLTRRAPLLALLLLLPRAGFVFRAELHARMRRDR
jgi:hypothetical protein